VERPGSEVDVFEKRICSAAKASETPVIVNCMPLHGESGIHARVERGGEGICWSFAGGVGEEYGGGEKSAGCGGERGCGESWGVYGEL
jgi:hypothetical protein